MTVAELINILQQYDPNLPVVSSTGRIDEVIFREEYYDGDCANPNCPIINAIEIV